MVVVNHMRYGQTVIQNAFIDRYIASANGEYVKVYIMLLRLMDEENLSLSRLADALEITSQEVVRALSYWEKQGILSLVYEDGKLSQLVMMDLPNDKRNQSVTKGASITLDDNCFADEKKEDKPEPLKVEKSVKENLLVDEGFKEMLFVLEQYLARPLTNTDRTLFIWLYDELKFSSELIEYLVEYCVSLKKTSNRYMRAVAENWKSEGIDSVEKAKKQNQLFAENKKKGTAASGNKFHNFDQSKTDLDAIINEEIRNGA